MTRIHLSLIALSMVFGLSAAHAQDSPADLNDLQIAHVAYTADNIDIQYAHLALALSKNQAVKDFANTMIRDHNAVNEQALALLKKLKADPQDNFLSKALQEGAVRIVNELSQLRGPAFDRRYAENELAYHQAVNNLMSTAFIPNIESKEVEKLFKASYKIFLTHEKHAEMMVRSLN